MVPSDAGHHENTERIPTFQGQFQSRRGTRIHVGYESRPIAKGLAPKIGELLSKTSLRLNKTPGGGLLHEGRPQAVLGAAWQRSSPPLSPERLDPASQGGEYTAPPDGQDARIAHRSASCLLRLPNQHRPTSKGQQQNIKTMKRGLCFRDTSSFKLKILQYMRRSTLSRMNRN